VSTYRINLSHIASFKLRSILEYVESEWSVHTRNDLLKTFVDLTNQIQPMETIEIITVFDNRQDPEEIMMKLIHFI